MNTETLLEIYQLLHQARKLLPEPPPAEDKEIYEIHRRIFGLEIAVQQLAVKRGRADQKTDRQS